MEPELPAASGGVEPGHRLRSRRSWDKSDRVASLDQVNDPWPRSVINVSDLYACAFLSWSNPTNHGCSGQGAAIAREIHRKSQRAFAQAAGRLNAETPAAEGDALLLQRCRQAGETDFQLRARCWTGRPAPELVGRGQAVLHDLHEFFTPDWFFQNGLGAQVIRLPNREVAEAGEENHARLGRLRLVDFLEQGHAVHHRHADVRKDEMHLVGRQSQQSFGSISREQDTFYRALEPNAHGLTQEGLVLHQEYRCMV